LTATAIYPSSGRATLPCSPSALIEQKEQNRTEQLKKLGNNYYLPRRLNNIPKIPKHDEGGTLAKLPSFLQNNRKQLHQEIAKDDLEMWNAIVNVAKQEGLFKQFW
jgi:hypothetical protein